LICLNEASHLRSVGGGEVWSRDREGRDVW